MNINILKDLKSPTCISQGPPNKQLTNTEILVQKMVLEEQNLKDEFSE